MTEDNPNFSERYGYQVSKSIQYESINDELRIGIWNTVYKIYEILEDRNHHKLLCNDIWIQFLKKPLPFNNGFFIMAIYDTKDFILKSDWYEVFDFIEFFINLFQNDRYKKYIPNKLIEDSFQNELEKENSGYRIINKKITPITSSVEIESIHNALEVTETEYQSVFTHLEKSLNFLANRELPDYKNSIKESISAVEAICCLLANDKKASLNNALNIIEKKGIKIHSAFKEAIIKLYGYTSDEGGIRHKEFNPTKVYFEDAKFMLVSCTNFINYLIVKSDKAGIVLE